MKLILLFVILLFACAIAMLLVARLLNSAKQIAALRSDLARNGEILNEQLKQLERERAQYEARQALEAERRESGGAEPPQDGANPPRA